MAFSYEHRASVSAVRDMRHEGPCSAKVPYIWIEPYVDHSIMRHVVVLQNSRNLMRFDAIAAEIYSVVGIAYRRILRIELHDTTRRAALADKKNSDEEEKCR